jgi:alpha-glucoside transport system permease protein
VSGEGGMLQQIIYATTIVAGAIAVFLGYFWGANWLLDRSLAVNPSMPNDQITRRDRIRSRIRPWIFIAPALIFLCVYLVYPVFETFRLSLYDSLGQHYVGGANYHWAFGNPLDWFKAGIDPNTGESLGLDKGDPTFWRSALNNLLWLIIVPFFSTAIGLLVAVFADRVWWGGIAKTLVFMPMAISFVGAAVIWRFVYAYRAPGEEQIGLLNAIVTSFGGEPQAWMQIPWLNSFLLMIILIWIQTGFAMVILSAALRGIPSETIEAARIDGANERQIFFGIMIPQIGGTLLVVWTTITIIVLKVFDIVFAMTNGENDTQVLANLMYRMTFRSDDYGRGAAVAIVIMIAVIPVMIFNIRRARAASGAL